MKLLKEINDKELPRDEFLLKKREASRAVIFDDDNLIALLFVGKDSYHKIPGGGIEFGEDKMQALTREIKEETGCEIEVTGEVGEIVEFRSKFNLQQISYCYLGKVISKGATCFDQGEISHEFKLLWLPLSEAIIKLENDKPLDYEGMFIQERDLVFLKKAAELIKI
jgi:8-oxo-dGTP diphosphatase